LINPSIKAETHESFPLGLRGIEGVTVISSFYVIQVTPPAPSYPKRGILLMKSLLSTAVLNYTCFSHILFSSIQFAQYTLFFNFYSANDMNQNMLCKESFTSSSIASRTDPDGVASFSLADEMPVSYDRVPLKGAVTTTFPVMS